MSSRIFSLVLFVSVAACGGPPESVAPGADNRVDTGSGTPAEAPAERIDCAIGGATYANVCTIERTTGKSGTLLTIRHPDGGFRRLLVSPDGREVAAADGAAPVAVVARSDDAIEVAIADARYRLPVAR